MFSKYYDCPKDYRKNYGLMLLQITGRIISTAVIIIFLLLLLVKLS